ncbi:hypothetical protein DFH27DRAFT_615212 [Peziza echinospora]|nr:hypothetical protein DFH27DRAFT_615212 [Peziza echinospora]
MVSPSELIPQTWKYAEKYMSQPGFDASHDFSHLQRVVAVAHKIYDSSSEDFKQKCDRDVVTLLALLHDVGDKKYQGATSASDMPTKGPVESFLLSIGSEEELAALVQLLATNVSFSNEQKNRKFVHSLAEKHPELAVVQDADRVDAIGAIGIARVITFGMTKRPQDGWQGVVNHYGDKLSRLAEEMKTVTGRKLAAERGERVRIFFEEWWNDEFPAMPATKVSKP